MVFLPWSLLDMKQRWAAVFRLGVVGLALCLSLAGKQTWAQTTIYTWTDEKGVTHYSNSMVPTRHSERATTLVMPSPSSFGTAGSSSIPLVLLNNDPSQKFVRAVLQGEHSSKEVLMLVDTGAQRTLIDEELAQELDLEHIQDALLAGVTGSAYGWIGRLPMLRLGTVEVRDLHIMVAPVTGRLLLGMDVLERLALSVGPRSLDPAK